jgi:hypothetical protein
MKSTIETARIWASTFKDGTCVVKQVRDKEARDKLLARLCMSKNRPTTTHAVAGLTYH